MEAGETPRPGAESERLSGEQVRRATFPQALRGYDREAVHDLLDRVADWMEGKAGAVAGATPGMREEFAKVGERTAGILAAADEAASNLRSEAKEYADRLRSEADDASRKARLNASQRMDEMVAEAETKAQRIIDDAVARRRQLNQAISSLLERRDEIAADTAKLAEELLHAVEELRAPDPRDEEDAAEPGAVEDEESSEEVVAEPASKTTDESDPDPDPEFDQTVIIEPDPEVTELHKPDLRKEEDELDSVEDEEDSDEFGTRDKIQGPSKLLIDPDEDETPPRGVPRSR